MSRSKILMEKYFKQQSFIDSDIGSFNNLVEKEISGIINENKDIEPTIIPQNIDSFKIRFDRIWVTKPEITEADGSKRNIYPAEARLRKITYSAPIFVEVSAHINDVQRESLTTQIGNLPIMLKSNNCHLSKLSREELISKGEDPEDPGGYFIINGTEKVLVHIEDLAPNRVLVEKDTTSPNKFTGKIFSERGSFKIPHTLKKMNDGIFYLSFTRVKKIPIIMVIKALGLLKDEDIMKFISSDKTADEVVINLYEFVTVKAEEEAIDYIARKIGITQTKEIRIERMSEILDKYLLPHLGTEKKDRIYKAYNLCKFLKKYILVSNKELPLDDKDHYMNKKLKLSGDLLSDLLRVNFKVLIGDLLYNFQRIVKRGKFPSIKAIIREKLLTQRIDSAMATGNWVGGRKGISQRIQRLNFLETLSHLQRVVSPLSASQENFEARALHSTHLGRLCPIETPEGTNIGLRKNLSLLTSISGNSSEEEVMKSLSNLGMKTVKL
ncbi:DNA-directed RNA polymerase subunit B'' [Candidatus Woesearchaeota archaeon]|nr:DNA-directed RNA polymerase subunit B'' [Candidatus Woesearchaeota archaeon]